MKILILVIVLSFSCLGSRAQELNSILENETEYTTEVVSAIFKGTRIANGHSVETRKKNVLDFLVTHRFGTLNSGFDDFFGLDEANIRLALEYALMDDLTLALGRSSYEKTYDAYAKYRLFYQKTGKNPFPVSVTIFGSVAEKTLKDYDPDNKPSFEDRLVYTSQILIARKFSPSFSLQLSPSYIHFNTVPTTADPNDMFALGVGARIKVSNRIAINGEYYYNFNPFESMETENSLALGLEIETGGHVFQLVFTNARPMIEKGFITQATGDFFDGDIHFGFNISRAFHLGKPKNTKIPNESN